MRPREVLALCRQLGARGTFAVAVREHDQLSSADVRHVLTSAAACEHRGGKRWLVHGSSLDGEATSLNLVVDESALTVIGSGESSPRGSPGA